MCSRFLNRCHPANTAAPTDDALDALSRLPGLEIVHRPTLEGGADVVDVSTTAGTDRYVIEIRRRITSNVVPALLSHLEQRRAERPEPPLLLSDYVSPATAAQLERHGVAYADAAGNVHLDGPAAFMHIQGLRPTRTQHPKGLTATDLTLVFAILSRPSLVRDTMRDIAATTGVSLGKVSATLKALDALDLVRTRARTRSLHDPQRLLQRWEIGYLETVRPRLNPTTWRLPSGTSLDEVHERARTLPDALVSGEYAAAALTRHLKPSSLTLHLAPTETKRAAVELRLRPSDAGAPDVIIIDRFLPALDVADEAFVAPSSTPIAHPILARAELLALGSDRLREVADRLRDQLILPRLVGGA